MSDVGLHTGDARIVSPRIPLFFVENRGQSRLPGEFLTYVGGGAVAFGPDWFLLQQLGRPCWPDDPAAEGLRAPSSRSACDGINLLFTFDGASPDARLQPESPLATHINVYRGQDPSQWHEDIPAFAGLRQLDVYPGIDVAYRDADGVLEYDLLLAPGADPGAIIVRCAGADGLSVSTDGGLAIETCLGTWRLPPPVTYLVEDAGGPVPIACSYVQHGSDTFGFRPGSWSGTGPLVIDPSLAFATFLGGTKADAALTVAVDGAGSAYVGGIGGGAGFPTTPGAFATTGISNISGFLAKFTPDGAGLEYATYLDGTSSNYVQAVAVTADGEAVAACSTQDTTFPTTPGAFDATYNGGTFDGVVLKLDALGGHLVFSTYIGGADDDLFYDVALAADGSVLVTGESDSADYPTTPGALRESGAGDAVVTKVAPDGSWLVFSTYLGAPAASDHGFGIACDVSGDTVVVGRSYGSGFPVTPGAYDLTHNGNNGIADAFVARLDESGSTLIAATYLGGSFGDEAREVAIAPGGSVYLTGSTDSSNYPATPGVVQPWKSGSSSSFVAHFDQDLSSLLHSTFLGGGGAGGEGIGFGLAGEVVVGSAGGGSSLLLTPDAALTTDLGAFLVVLDPALGTLLYGSYAPGALRHMTVDATGSAYFVGQKSSQGPIFPATPGAFDTTMGGPNDAYLAKFDLSPWSNLGSGLAGTLGLVPHLSGSGALQPGSAGALQLADARPSSPATIVVGTSAIDAPFKGGTLVPAPLLLIPAITDAAGALLVPWSQWPVGLPAGTQILFQAWVIDPGGPKGLAASNAITAATPVPFAN